MELIAAVDRCWSIGRGEELLFSMTGYGHGVGMSQWGAYAMAKQGYTAEDIVMHYFAGVTIDQAWQ